MDQKMTTKTPLKTNTRWQRDESSEDKKSSTFSDNRNNGGGYSGRGRGRGGYRDRGGYRGGYRRGGYRGRGGGFRDSRNGFSGRKRKPANFVLPEGDHLETDFPVLGKPKVKNANDLDWRIAAEKGVIAPPPPRFMKKKSIEPNSLDGDINLDDYDEEEYDSTFCDDDDDGSFPTKGGYMD